MDDPTDSLPESRVLIVMTGGTICMKRSSEGLVPARGFLDNALAPRAELNDGLPHDPIDVKENDADPPKRYRSLRTPLSTYGKQVR